MTVLERSVRVLEVLGQQGEAIGVVQLGEQLGLPTSTLHRLLASLLSFRLVTQDADSKRYRLGPRVLALARKYLQQNTLIGVAQPHLAALRSSLQETVFLTALVGDEAVCVATAESPRPLQFYMRVGQRMPYHAAASARSILAFRPPREAERLLREEGLESFTRQTPQSVVAVMDELGRVRRQGYAICAEEMEVGVMALSAPVRDTSGQVVASVTVVAPAVRFSPTRRDGALAALLESAAHISADLGYHRGSFERSTSLGPRREPSLLTRSAVAITQREEQPCETT